MNSQQLHSFSQRKTLFPPTAGEAFDDDSQLVNGAVVSVRNKGDKIGMWLGDASIGESIMSIGKKVKQRLGIDLKVGY